jgi:hypothetical protein
MELDVLDTDGALFFLINTVGALSAMDGRRLAIIHLLFSRGELDADVVSPGRNSLLSPAILRNYMDVVDAHLDSCP